MKIKFNNRTDTGFGYYSFHDEYKDATLPATHEGTGYLVHFPEKIHGEKHTWWYSAAVIGVLDET
jgi:hypothetical protein